MQGGYQLFDFKGLTPELNILVDIPFNLRDYVNKQVRATGLNIALSDVVRIHDNSVLTFNTFITEQYVSIQTVVYDELGDLGILRIKQAYNDANYKATITYTVY